ncbi:unnamed protein product, partial [Ectocarpus sp. 8 AP-2014]
MGAASAVGRGHLPSKRPVYRYIFSCPAKAQAQALAVSGVCYFNMRAQEEGKVVPAEETTEGILCIEMRIRMYHDGAMSKLLEKLSKDTDNAVVQLQGPFLVNKLAPPPAHRNVIMIAAGTGVNPSAQRWDTTFSTRSRLVLVWQSTTEADFYGTDEITAMQKSNGLLEVTALTSEGGRRRNAPGTAFRKARDMAWNVFGSPAPSNTSSANPFTPAGYGATMISGSSNYPPKTQWELLVDRSFTWRNLKWNESPTTGGRRREPMQDTSNYQVGDGLVRGRVNREILETVFGEALVSSIAAYNRQRALNSLACSDSDVGDEKEGQGEDDGDLIGTDQTAGKLQ